MKLYEKIKNFLCKYDYCVYIFLLFFLLGTCFFECFVYISVVYVFLIGLFVDETIILCLLVFIYPFSGMFVDAVIPFTSMFDLYRYILIVNLIIRHIFISIKSKSKLNLKVIISFLIYTLYLLIPRPKNGINFVIILYYCLDFLLVYITLQKRLKIKFSKVIEIFIISTISSCFIGLLKPITLRFDRIILNVKTQDIVRFSGLITWPTAFGVVVTCAISLLCIMKYLKKINNIKFYVYNLLLLFFGLKTISRGFLISVLLVYFTFGISCLIKYKKSSLKELLYIYAGVIIVFLISFKNISILFERISDGQVFEDIDISNQELWNKILNGEIRYDPGRKGIWEFYIKDILSSPFVLLFGRGICRPFLAQMCAHNHFIHYIWQNGLIGVFVLILNIILFIDFKNFNIKNIRKKLYSLIFLLPLGFILLIEVHLLSRFLYFLFVVILWLEDEVDEKINKVDNKNENLEIKDELEIDFNDSNISINSQDDKKIELNS